MTRAIVLVGLLATACGGADPTVPERLCTDAPVAIETVYSIDGSSLTCIGTTSQTSQADGMGPLYHACTWLSVIVNGEPMSWATIEFVRDAVGAEWRVEKVHTSPAAPGCGLPAI